MTIWNFFRPKPGFLVLQFTGGFLLRQVSLTTRAGCFLKYSRSNVPSAGAVLVDQCAASSTIKSKESQQYIGRAGAQITAEVKS